MDKEKISDEQVDDVVEPKPRRGRWFGDPLLEIE